MKLDNRLLKEIAQFKNGKKRPNTAGSIPVYGGNGILDYVDTANNENCIIIGRVGAYCGSVYYESGKCWVSDNAISVSPKENIDVLYLYYLLKQLHLNERHIGTSQPLLTQEILNSISCTVLEKSTQKKVSQLLRSIDEKIALNQKINDNLEQQAQVIFKSWFVNFEPFGGVALDSWNIVTLEDMTSLVSRGIAPKYAEESDQVVLNQKCIRNHVVDLSEARTHIPKKINEKWLQYGDVLINSTGTGTLGRVAQVWFEPHNMTVDSHVTIVRPASKELIYYVGIWGITHEREIESLHTGSTGQTELPRDRVKAIELLCPDKDTLNRFNVIVAPMTAMIAENQEENKRLSAIRDTLLPKLMGGEIQL